MSSVKSWTALPVGPLIHDGLLRGVDAGVTIRHLLTMTSGLRRRTANPHGSIGFVADKGELLAAL